MADTVDIRRLLDERKQEAQRLGYYVVAGVDEDEWNAIAQLIPATPHTLAALREHNADSIRGNCPFTGDDAKPFAVLAAVDEALTAARSL